MKYIYISHEIYIYIYHEMKLHFQNWGKPKACVIRIRRSSTLLEKETHPAFAAHGNPWQTSPC